MTISYIDDGMGNFLISRVFVYSSKSKDFEELIPDCGEQFLNLRLDKKNKSLISTYYKDNIPTLCETLPPKSFK